MLREKRGHWRNMAWEQVFDLLNPHLFSQGQFTKADNLDILDAHVIFHPLIIRY
jgi:hypothetical protein